MTIRSAARSAIWFGGVVLPLEIPIVCALCLLVYLVGLGEGHVYQLVTGHVWMANPPKL